MNIIQAKTVFEDFIHLISVRRGEKKCFPAKVVIFKGFFFLPIYDW